MMGELVKTLLSNDGSFLFLLYGFIGGIKMKNELIGLFVRNKKERKEIHKVCIKYDFPLLYPNIFNGKNYLYAFNKDGIALTGTFIISKLKTVVHGPLEFEEYLKNNYFQGNEL